MKYQDKSYLNLSTSEMLAFESNIHDNEYKDSTPFFSPTMEINIPYVLKINDHCFKYGRYIRGFRKKRLFKLMDLQNIDGKKILDVGCGNGQHTVFFAMHGAKVHAFDISKVGVSIAKKCASVNNVADNCHFSVQNISEMNYEDDSFDIVVFNAVLHHVLKYPNVIEETKRVLKNGGLVFFAEGMRGNKVYSFFRYIFRKITGRRALGDIDLEYDDYMTFSKAFAIVHIETFCLFQSIKPLICKPINNNLLVSIFLFIFYIMDILILKLFPFLGKYCTEIVGVLKNDFKS